MEPYWFQGELYKWRFLGYYSPNCIGDMFHHATEMGVLFNAKGREREDGYIVGCSVFGCANDVDRFKQDFATIDEEKEKACCTDFVKHGVCTHTYDKLHDKGE